MSRGGKRKGAGRKPSPFRKALTMRISTYTFERFKLYCKLAKLSQARAFELMVREANSPSAVPKAIFRRTKTCTCSGFGMQVNGGCTCGFNA